MDGIFESGGEHIRIDNERIKQLIKEARLLIGDVSYGRKCMDGRVAPETRGDRFDQTSDKTHQDFRRDRLYDYGRDATTATPPYHNNEHVANMNNLDGSLLWKYPNAIDTHSWETPTDVHPKLDD